MMKALLLILAVLFYCTEVKAQNPCAEKIAKNSYGIKIGYNHTNATGPDQFVKYGRLQRFQAAVYGKRYLYNNWYIKASATYNQKGNTYDDTYPIADGGKTVSIRLNYIETSIDAGYTIVVNDKHNIHIGTGPYLAYGINGTEKGYAGSLMGPIKIDKEIDFTNSGTNTGTNPKIKPLDAGINFNIEYQYRKYGLFLNYGLGLANRENWGESFNRVVSVGVSYSIR